MFSSVFMYKHLSDIIHYWKERCSRHIEHFDTSFLTDFQDCVNYLKEDGRSIRVENVLQEHKT